MGEDAPRQITSGLREHYSLEDLQDRKVVVVCNLKEAKIQGFVSSGMVLAAKLPLADGTTRVELIAPPADALVGERVVIQGVNMDSPWPANAIKKHKVWEAVSVGLRTDDQRTACWNSQPLVCSSGPCVVNSNADAPIS